jgi:hypothetical protein
MALTVSDIRYSGLTDTIMSMKGVTDAAGATAQTIYCGFTPRYVLMMNLTDGIRSEFFIDNTAGTSCSTAANGTVTIAAANGFTALTGAEAPVATASRASGSPQTSGAGLTIGTAPLVASKTYDIIIYK